MHYDVTNPDVRATIEAARAWGVPVSVFLGRLRGPGIPDWLEEDRQAALDLLAWESQLCPGCREPLAETTAAENEFQYIPQTAIRCHRCTATSMASDAVESSPHSSALLIPIRLRSADVRGEGDRVGGPEAGGSPAAGDQ